MFAFVPGGTFFLRGREEVDPQGGVRPIVSSTFVGGGGGIFLGIGVKCCESVKYRYRIRIDRKNMKTGDLSQSNEKNSIFAAINTTTITNQIDREVKR